MKLSDTLKPNMQSYFSSDMIGRVKFTVQKIHDTLEKGDLDLFLCREVNKMSDLNMDSITDLIYSLSHFLTNGEGGHIDLLTVALLDVYTLLCCQKNFGISDKKLQGIIMMNMKFAGNDSGGKSNENLAVHVIEGIFRENKRNADEILSFLRKASELDEDKFISPGSLEIRKNGASCPLYAFKDSLEYIQKFWEIIEKVFLIVQLRFPNVQGDEAEFLSGKMMRSKIS